MSDDSKVQKILSNEKSIKDLIKRTEKLNSKVNILTSNQKKLMAENTNLKHEIAFLKRRDIDF